MALNFPDNPSDGDEYSASNGVVYTYNASTDTWTGSSAAGDNYWKETDDGGVLTTVAPDQNLEIEGNVTSGGNPGGGAQSGSRITNIGMVQASRDAGSNLWSGYTTGNSTATSIIDSDGSAVFQGTVQVGEYTPLVNVPGVNILEAGAVSVNRTAGTEGVWVGRLNRDVTSSILADGTATFTAYNINALDPLPDVSE